MPAPTSPLRLHQTGPLRLEVNYDGDQLGALDFRDVERMAAVRELLRDGVIDVSEWMHQDATVHVETTEATGTVYGADVRSSSDDTA